MIFCSAMPSLDAHYVQNLLELGRCHRACGECGQRTAMDYCRSCDEFYWIHRRGCPMYADKHFGHRLQIAPFIEVTSERIHSGPRHD